jgi:hypothetical protein
MRFSIGDFSFPKHIKYIVGLFSLYTDTFAASNAATSGLTARCCREDIPLKLIRQELSDEELRKFREAEIEFNTADRTYCSNVRCGKFIPLTNISSGGAICGRCGSTTCTMCSSPYHEDEECPADPTLQANLSLAHAQGWQRCYSCRAMVEPDHGCNYMTYDIYPTACLNLLMFNVVAIAELSSAMSVVSDGRPVPVRNGMKTDS